MELVNADKSKNVKLQTVGIALINKLPREHFWIFFFFFQLEF